MNIIVFDETEWGRNLPEGDERTIHIRDILKPVAGDTIKVGLLGRGHGTAVFSGWEKGQAMLSFPAGSALVPSPPLAGLTVLIGQPRPPVMQRLLKDLNALGVARIFVVASELSEKSYMQSRLWQAAPGQEAGYRRFLVQGAQQGGHCHLSHVERFYSLHKAIGALEISTEKLYLDIDPEATSLLAVSAALEIRGKNGFQQVVDICIALGPERGWTDREREMLREHQFVAHSLGQRILRTETACILSAGMLVMALEARHV